MKMSVHLHLGEISVCLSSLQGPSAGLYFVLPLSFIVLYTTKGSTNAMMN